MTRPSSTPSRQALCVINPAVRVAELECFNQIVAHSPIPATYHLPSLMGTRSLLQIQRPAGIIILGSGSSVYDSLPWKDALSDWLLPLMKTGTPTLGLCYGHQLIAHLFGAKVGYLNEQHEKTEGLRRVQLEPARIFRKIPREGELVVTHREIVTEVPASFEILATSAAVRVDGLYHSKLPIWSFQAHPEANSAFLKNNLKVEMPAESFRYGWAIMDAFLKMVGEANV